MNPDHILIINVTRIGDTILSTPAIKAIADAYPRAKITCLAHPNRVEILQHLPFLNNAQAISKKSALFRGWTCSIFGKPYDLAFVWGFDEHLVHYALRTSKQVIALRQKNEHINKMLIHAVTPPAFQSDHAVIMNMALPASLGIPLTTRRLSYYVTQNECDWAKQELTNSTPPTATLLIGVQVASFHTKSYRDWPIKNFNQLCSNIRQTHQNAHFLIFGGKMEHERTETLHHHLGGSATLYAGRLTLRETAALMSHLDLYIGVDTGPTHIMSTFNIPLVALYHGYSRSELIAPLDHPHLYAIDHPQAGPDCPTDASMAAISVDQVMEQVELALEAGQR